MECSVRVPIVNNSELTSADATSDAACLVAQIERVSQGEIALSNAVSLSRRAVRCNYLSFGIVERV